MNSNGDSFATLLNRLHVTYLAEPTSILSHVEVARAIVVLRGDLIQASEFIFIELLTRILDFDERVNVECAHLGIRKICFGVLVGIRVRVKVVPIPFLGLGIGRPNVEGRNLMIDDLTIASVAILYEEDRARLDCLGDQSSNSVGIHHMGGVLKSRSCLA